MATNLPEPSSTCSPPPQSAVSVVWPPHTQTDGDVDYESEGDVVEKYEEQKHYVDGGSSSKNIVQYKQQNNTGSDDHYSSVQMSTLPTYTDVNKGSGSSPTGTSITNEQKHFTSQNHMIQDAVMISQIQPFSSNSHSPIISQASTSTLSAAGEVDNLVTSQNGIPQHHSSSETSIDRVPITVEQLVLQHGNSDAHSAANISLPLVIDRTNLAAIMATPQPDGSIPLEVSNFQRLSFSTSHLIQQNTLLNNTQQQLAISDEVNSLSSNLMSPVLSQREMLVSMIPLATTLPSTSHDMVSAYPVNHKHVLAQKYAEKLEKSASSSFSTDLVEHNQYIVETEITDNRAPAHYAVTSGISVLMDSQAVAKYPTHQSVSTSSSQNFTVEGYTVERGLALVSSSQESHEELMEDVHHYATTFNSEPHGNTSVHSFVSSTVDLVSTENLDSIPVDSTVDSKLNSSEDDMVDSTNSYEEQVNPPTSNLCDTEISEEIPTMNNENHPDSTHNSMEMTVSTASLTMLCGPSTSSKADMYCDTVRSRRDVNRTSYWCKECDQFKEKECACHVVRLIVDKPVLSRAWASLPATYLYLHRIVDANNESEYGVFAKKTIPKRTQFGPIEGVLVKTEKRPNNRFLLIVEHNEDHTVYLDTSEESRSNWMRFVRPAESYCQQNLVLVQQGQSLYFNTTRAINPRTELRVWYSPSYAESWCLPLLEMPEEETRGIMMMLSTTDTPPLMSSVASGTTMQRSCSRYVWNFCKLFTIYGTLAFNCQGQLVEGITNNKKVEHNEDHTVYLDTSEESRSNWMRFVRPAESYCQQNLVLVQQGQSLYFNTTRAINPRTELRVWYSPSYAESWCLPLLEMPEEETRVDEIEENAWPCFECNKQFPTSLELQKHLNQHDDEEPPKPVVTRGRGRGRGRGRPPKGGYYHHQKCKPVSETTDQEVVGEPVVRRGTRGRPRKKVIMTSTALAPAEDFLTTCMWSKAKLLPHEIMAMMCQKLVVFMQYSEPTVDGPSNLFQGLTVWTAFNPFIDINITCMSFWGYCVLAILQTTLCQFFVGDSIFADLDVISTAILSLGFAHFPLSRTSVSIRHASSVHFHTLSSCVAVVWSFISGFGVGCIWMRDMNSYMCRKKTGFTSVLLLESVEFWVASEEVITQALPQTHKRPRGRPPKNPELTAKHEEFECEICHKVFPRNYSLQRHMIMHTGEKRFKCPICDMKFSHVYNRNRHVRRHRQRGETEGIPRSLRTLPKRRENRMWACSNCPLVFDNSKILNLHSEIHDSTEAQQEENDSNRTNSKATSRIKENEINNLVENVTKCPKCKKPFTDKKALCEHVAIHGKTYSKVISVKGLINPQKPYKCNLCYKSFATDERLMRHYLVHGSDESKPLQCDVCLKRFLNNSALACHIKVHNEDRKTYECPMCKQNFDQMIGLKEHVHSHSENGVFTCPHCQKRCEEYNQIRKHIRAFHSDKRYPCEKCDKVFPRPDKLKLHMLRHSNHREFLCADCGKQFKRKDKLKEHMKRMHGPDRDARTNSRALKERTTKKFVPKVSPTDYHRFIYKCHTCLLGFKRRGMLVNHLARRHPDIRPESVPELNLPILKTTRDYYCQYCEKIYKSSSKRKAHILKNHPGAELPMSNRQKGGIPEIPGLPNPTFSQTVGSITTHPHHCNWCHKQYASKAKLLQHQRKKHLEMLALSYATSKNQHSVPELSPERECPLTGHIVITQSIPSSMASSLTADGAIIIDATKRKPQFADREGSPTADTLPSADLLTQAMSELTQSLNEYRPAGSEYLAARISQSSPTTLIIPSSVQSSQPATLVSSTTVITTHTYTDTSVITPITTESTSSAEEPQTITTAVLDNVQLAQLLAQYQQQPFSILATLLRNPSTQTVTSTTAVTTDTVTTTTSNVSSPRTWPATTGTFTEYPAR
ncbi:uncharacterized protein LOC143227370 [Tachypleus tridentatus]|uniref:uncharacterized protein LOC143227370 n=1 Tax=Tachypleus tridentatus TaxID=6853 RepID=UPI003FD5EF60